MLRTENGKIVASGEMIQTIQGQHVTTELVFHFNDGSIYDEVAVFSQGRNFRLLTDHLKQQGPSFKKTRDVYIDALRGLVKTSTQNGATDEHHLQIPDDAANGIILVLIRNISSSTPETVVSLVAATSKPKIVKLKIHPEGEQEFFTSGYQRKAIRYGIHVDIGGLAGAVAPVVGKEPPDTHIWVARSKVPIAIRFEGPLVEDGPVWIIDIADIQWNKTTQE